MYEGFIKEKKRKKERSGEKVPKKKARGREERGWSL